MSRLFSVFLLSMVMLLPAARMQRIYAQPVFFSMLFPQLIPEWMLSDGAEGVML